MIDDTAVLWRDEAEERSRYSGMTSPPRWVTPVRLEAAQTTGTGSGDSQISEAGSEDDSLRGKTKT